MISVISNRIEMRDTKLLNLRYLKKDYKVKLNEGENIFYENIFSLSTFKTLIS